MAHLARQRNTVDKGTLEILGGTLRPGDPRRFIVEAMVCAMNADGVIDPRELAVLRRHLAGHELFRAVPPTVADTMISLASDAMTFAGGPLARLTAIAAGLPSRIHRLHAYAMAVEITQSDGSIVPAEVSFLERLRHELRISAAEGLEIARTLADGRLGDYLAARVAAIRGLVPAAAELFTMRARVRHTLDDAHLAHVRDLFLALPDLGGAPDEIEGQLRAAFRTPRPESVELFEELRQLASTIPDPVDRWWLIVYVLADEPGAGRAWRRGLFGCLLQAAFGLGEQDVDLAASEAKLVAAAPNLRAVPPGKELASG